MFKVLLVESSAFLSNMVSMNPNIHDFLFEKAFTITQANSLLQSTKFDIIVSEISMPDGTYQDILQYINASITPNTKIPLIILADELNNERTEDLKQQDIYAYEHPLSADIIPDFIDTLKSAIYHAALP